MSDYLVHHGIPGMRWGVRRYQARDGSLTSAGKRRYSSDSNKPRMSKKKMLGTAVAASLALYGAANLAGKIRKTNTYSVVKSEASRRLASNLPANSYREKLRNVGNTISKTRNFIGEHRDTIDYAARNIYRAVSKQPYYKKAMGMAYESLTKTGLDLTTGERILSALIDDLGAREYDRY